MADPKDDLWAETGDDPIWPDTQKAEEKDWTSSIGDALANHIERLEESGWLKELQRMGGSGNFEQEGHKEARMLAGLAGMKGQEMLDQMFQDDVELHTKPKEDRWLLELPPEEE